MDQSAGELGTGKSRELARWKACHYDWQVFQPANSGHFPVAGSPVYCHRPPQPFREKLFPVGRNHYTTGRLNSSYQRNLFPALVGDGTPLLMLTAVALLFSGGFALFLSATGHFLPHDIDFLGMTAQQLCSMNQCRVVHFMFHDRISFGGALIALGALYLWLIEFPLRHGEGWAWWILLLSCVTGFASFLAYLGYGYLDTWHGAATLFLLPCVAIGLWRSFRTIRTGRSVKSLVAPAMRADWKSRYGMGRLCLMAVAFGMIFGGLTIMLVGMTRVFVPQDVAFLGLSIAEMNAINPKLIPLIAHDRAGFGGGVCSCGIIVLFLAWCGQPCRSLWQVLLVAGGIGFATAIGVHPLIGYNDFIHLAPALLGLVVFVVGMVLLKKPMIDHGNIVPNERSKETVRSTAEAL